MASLEELADDARFIALVEHLRGLPQPDHTLYAELAGRPEFSWVAAAQGLVARILDAVPVACACDPHGHRPHRAECAATKAMGEPLECYCGDASGIPHPHLDWADPSPRVLSHKRAGDGRCAEIRPADVQAAGDGD